MLANHCRAHLLLEKEYFKLNKYPLWGIDAHPVNENNFLNWHAVISGPRETLWEGGLFRVFISFNDGYNFKPPDAFSHTIPFHPNVDMKTGRPCIDFMDDSNHWNENYNLVYVLLNLQVMLANPVLDNPINIEAAKMLRSSPKQYRQMVFDSVYASKRFNAGLSPFIANQSEPELPELPVKESIYTETSRSRTRQSVMNRVSFEEYYKTWTSIATSKPSDVARVPENEIVTSDVVMDQLRSGVPGGEDLEAELRKQITEHKSVMYGRFVKKQSDQEKIAELQAAKAQILEQMYFKNQDLEEQAESIAAPSSPSVSARVKGQDPIEDEVDELVAWTTNLPEV